MPAINQSPAVTINARMHEALRERAAKQDPVVPGSARILYLAGTAILALVVVGFSGL